MSPSICLICTRLGSIEKSYSVPGAPMEDRPLPTAASRLAIVPSLDYRDKKQYHVRRCPNCATLYTYRFKSVITTNGAEDEEILIRMNADAADLYLRQRARMLEAQRRDIDDADKASASLREYVEHRHPAPEEIERIVEQMQSQRARVLHGRKWLHTQVEAYRRACPEILMIWAQAHRRVCQYFLQSTDAAIARPGLDVAAARYVARTTLEAWEALPERGETFISINEAYLVDYAKRLRAELGKA